MNTNTSESQQMEDEIDKLIREDVDAEEDGTFIDLDNVGDMEELKKRFADGEFERMDLGDDDAEDVDIEQLIKEIQEMEGIRDDDESSEDDDGATDDIEDIMMEDGRVERENEDMFQKQFESQDFLEEALPREEKGTPSTAAVPDWLSTRRSKLAMGMMTPADARKKQTEGSMPIVKHTLLSSKEIINSLVNGGAMNVELIEPDEDVKSYLGWDGLIIATANSYSHIRVLTDAIVHNLQKRGLAERGVVGAKYGSEGGEDPTMSAYARRKRRIGRGKKTDDGWMSVDCRNFIVHVQDDVTRRSVDLEGLWSPGSEKAKLLRRLDPKDEDAVDEFVAANPIPEEYMESMQMSGDFFGSDGRGGYASNSRNRNDTKNGRYTPTNNQKRKPKNRGRFG